MFEVRQLAENTFYYEAFTNVGIYRLNDREAVLIDSCDHKRMVKGLDRILTEMGLSVSLIINTHGHVDHICGNKYFRDKYGCRILSTALEKTFIANPELEADFYNAALSVDKRNNPFYGIEATESEIITADNVPEGFGIIPLPGHGFDMIGVRTPDNVVFLADAVLSRYTWESYKLPFFYNVNKSLETLEKIRSLKAEYFVPSHDAPVRDIGDLAMYNEQQLREKKQMVFQLCENQSFESLFELVAADQGLDIKTPKYCMYAVMVKNYLQALIEKGKVYSVYENGRMIYRTKSLYKA